PVTTTNASHSYSTPGDYPVSLIVRDGHGCSNSYTVQVVVSPMPVPSFTAGPVFKCTAPLAVTFTNTSTHLGSTTYLWHFGDGGSSNQINPTHTYTASGTYNVTLILNQHGCIDSIIKPSAISIQNIAASFVATP